MKYQEDVDNLPYLTGGEQNTTTHHPRGRPRVVSSSIYDEAQILNIVYSHENYSNTKLNYMRMVFWRAFCAGAASLFDGKYPKHERHTVRYAEHSTHGSAFRAWGRGYTTSHKYSTVQPTFHL